MPSAIENISKSFKATEEFLTPIKITKWLKLAFIAIFIGSISININFLPPDIFNSTNLHQINISEIISFITDPIILFLFSAMIIMLLFFTVLSSIMEFTLIESIKNQKVKIKQYTSQNISKGIQLSIIRIALSLLSLLLIISTATLIISSILTNNITLIHNIILVPLLLITLIIISVLNDFNTKFIVPIMIKKDLNIANAWKKLTRTVKSNHKEYLIYIFINFFLSILTSIISSLAFIITMLILLIPLGILAMISFFIISQNTILGIIFFSITAIISFITLISISLVIKIPIIVYLRYFAILVLGDIETKLDIIPDQRKNLS